MTNPLSAPVAPPRTNTLAIIGFIGVFFVSIVGIVFGVLAQRQIAVTGEGGAGLAKAALILGIVFTVLYGVFFVLWFSLFFFALSQGAWAS